MNKRIRVHYWGFNQTTTGAGLWATMTSAGLFDDNSHTLDTKEGHLNVLDVVVTPSIPWIVGISAPVDDGRNSVEHARVHNNHPLDSAKDAWVCQNQTKATVEDHRLTSDHDHPSTCVEDFADPEDGKAKVLDHQSDSV